MGRQERARKLGGPLLRAGLEVLAGGVPESVLPVRAVGMSSHDSPEPGVRVAFLEYGAPRLVERANQQWYELAVSFGLLDEDREFLLALPGAALSVQQLERRMVNGPEVHWVWRRVRLLERWDVMGVGAAGHLGVRSGHPAFMMLSLDGGAAVVGTTWEGGIGSIAVPDPAGRTATRRYLEWASTGDTRLFNLWEPREASAYLRRQELIAGSTGQTG